MIFKQRLLFTILFAMLAAPVRAGTTTSWTEVDPAYPGFVYDPATLVKALFPASDASGAMANSQQELKAYIKVDIRRPGHRPGLERSEEWAFDCAGRYAVLQATEGNAEGGVAARYIISNRSIEAGGSAARVNIQSWGPEHFMVPTGTDAGVAKMEAIACTPTQTSLDASRIAEPAVSKWARPHAQTAAGTWSDQIEVEGGVDADQITLKIRLFAAQSQPDPLDLRSRLPGVKIGLVVDATRTLNFFPAQHYEWAYKSSCVLAVSAPDLDTAWGYDQKNHATSSAVLVARNPAAARALSERIFAGDYDLTLTCEDYPQPIVAHIDTPLPEATRHAFESYVAAHGGPAPNPFAQGL